LTPPIDAALKKVKGLEGCWMDNATKELAICTAKKIAESEPIMADLVQAGKVTVVATYYNLSTGEVSLLS
jgi:carbonic anhydrase